MNAMGRTELFQPMYFYKGEPLLNKHLVKHMFDKLKKANEKLMVEFHNDPLSIKVTVDKTYDSFVLLKKHLVIEGESVYLPFTISYSDVISQEVHIKGKGGKLRVWETAVPAPESQGWFNGKSH